MNYREFSSWFFSGALSILVVILGHFGGESLEELKLIRKEITELNLKMVAVVSNQTSQQIQIEKIEKRVERLENRP